MFYPNTAPNSNALAMRICNVLILLVLTLGVVHCQIDWAHLTAHELRQLDPSLFTNITIAQFISIPTHAFRGWRADQVQNIPADVFHHILPSQLNSFEKDGCAGFTAAQMQLPGDLCNNFNPHGCFRHIPPASFGGFNSHCLSAFTNQIVKEISGQQFSFLTPDSLIGFECHQLYTGVHSDVFPIITPAQLNGFVSDACCFINYRMHTMKDETLRAMQPHCLENAQYDAFKNITLTQFNWLSLDAVHAISSIHVIYGNPTLWMQLSTDQLINLSPGAWEGFAMESLFEQFFYRHGRSLVDQLAARQIADVFTSVDNYRIIEIKENLYNHFAKNGGGSLYSWDQVKEELHYANWVKILLLNENEADFAKHFTRPVFSQIQHISLVGIRGAIFGQIDPSSFAVLDYQGLYTLTPDQVGNMTAAQWNGISTTALRDAYMVHLRNFIPPSVIPGIDTQHMAILASGSFLVSWTCPQILAMTEQQVAAFDPSDAALYRQDVTRCSAPTSSWAPYASSGPSPGVVSPTVVPSKPQGSSIGVGGVFAIILGGVAGLEAVMIGYYFYRKSRAVQYQAL